MEIITIESSAFKELTEQIKEIAMHIRKKEMHEVKIDAEDMMTTEEVAKFLRVSPRTLQRMRAHRIIDYTYAGKCCRYRKSDIERYVNERLSESERNSLYVPRIGKEAKNEQP